MTKRLLYVRTNGYDMLVSVDEENNVRFLTETEEFPYIVTLYDDDGTREDIAREFLESVEDDSGWEMAEDVEDLDKWLGIDWNAAEHSVIIAEIEKDL